MKPILLSVAILCLVLWPLEPVTGDEITMKDGRRFIGTVITERDDSIEFKTIIAGIKTTLTLKGDDVASIVKKPVPEGLFPDEAVPQKVDLIPFMNEAGKFGFINREGAVAIDAHFDFALPFSEGLAGVVVGKKLGFVNGTGKFQINPKFDIGIHSAVVTSTLLCARFSEGMASVQIDGRYGFVDRTGDFKIKPIYSGAAPFQQGTAYVIHGFQNGFINSKGRWVIRLNGESARQFSEDTVALSHKGKWGLYDRDGRKIIEPQFDRMDSPTEGLSLVSVSGRFGFVDTKGNMAINPRFEFGWSFSEGLAAVVQKGKVGFIDRNGQFVITPQFAYRRADSLFPLRFREGFAKVRVGDKWAFIDQKGKTLLGLHFDWARDFSDGITVVQNGEFLYWMTIKGKEIHKTQATQQQAIAIPPIALRYLGWPAHDQTVNENVDSHGAFVLGDTVNLLDGFSAERHGVRGRWSTNRDGTIQNAQESILRSGPMCVLPAVINAKEYDLQVKIARVAGDEAIMISLPAGNGKVLLAMDSRNAQGQRTFYLRDASKSVQKQIVNGRDYLVNASVRQLKDKYSITIAIDGVEILDGIWSDAELKPEPTWHSLAPGTISITVVDSGVKVSEATAIEARK